MNNLKFLLDWVHLNTKLNIQSNLSLAAKFAQNNKICLYYFSHFFTMSWEAKVDQYYIIFVLFRFLGANLRARQHQLTQGYTNPRKTSQEDTSRYFKLCWHRNQNKHWITRKTSSNQVRTSKHINAQKKLSRGKMVFMLFPIFWWLSSLLLF